MVTYWRWLLTRAQTILGQNFASLPYGNYKELPHVLNFYSCKKAISRNIWYFPLRNFHLLYLWMWLCYNILFSWVYNRYHLSSGPSREVNNKRKFQAFSLKSGCGCFRELVAYKRFQIYWFDVEPFGILENWSHTRDGRNWKFDCSDLSSGWRYPSFEQCRPEL